MMLVRSAMMLTMVMMMVSFEGGTALGQTLQEALATAYENNPTLNAQRARLRATDEQVPQALSGYRPTVRTFSEVGPRSQDSNEESLVGKENNALFGRTYGASIEQPLFRGGQTVAAVPRRRKHGAGRASAPGVDRAERVAQRGDRLLGCLSRPGGSRTEHPQRAAAREATGGDPRSLSSGRGDPDRRFAGGSPVGARDGGADRRGRRPRRLARHLSQRRRRRARSSRAPAAPAGTAGQPRRRERDRDRQQPQCHHGGVPGTQRPRFRRPGARRTLADGQPDRTSTTGSGRLAEGLAVRLGRGSRQPDGATLPGGRRLLTVATAEASRCRAATIARPVAKQRSRGCDSGVELPRDRRRRDRLFHQTGGSAPDRARRSSEGSGGGSTHGSGCAGRATGVARLASLTGAFPA